MGEIRIIVSGVPVVEEIPVIVSDDLIDAVIYITKNEEETSHMWIHPKAVSGSFKYHVINLLHDRYGYLLAEGERYAIPNRKRIRRALVKAGFYN